MELFNNSLPNIQQVEENLLSVFLVGEVHGMLRPPISSNCGSSVQAVFTSANLMLVMVKELLISPILLLTLDMGKAMSSDPTHIHTSPGKHNMNFNQAHYNPNCTCQYVIKFDCILLTTSCGGLGYCNVVRST